MHDSLSKPQVLPTTAVSVRRIVLTIMAGAIVLPCIYLAIPSDQRQPLLMPPGDVTVVRPTNVNNSSSEAVVTSETDDPTVAEHVVPEEFQFALTVPRSCPVMATFTSERLKALQYPVFDHRDAARQSANGSYACYRPSAGRVPPLCDRFQDFLDGRCDLATRRLAPQHQRDGYRYTRRPATGMLSPPVQHWFWTPVSNCTWRSVTRPLVGHGFLDRIREPRSDGPTTCPGSPDCRCWAHAGLWKPPAPLGGLQRQPRVGGQWVQSWDDVPSIATLFQSKKWFTDLLGVSTGGGDGAGIREMPPTIVFAGHSHARNLFLGAVGVLQDLVGVEKCEVRHGVLEHVAVGVMKPDGRFHPVFVYALSTAAGFAAVERSALERIFSDAGHVIEIRPDLILLSRGIWELVRADYPVDHLRATLASDLVKLRRAYPRAVIMTYLPHYVHSVDRGCAGRVRQVEWRDAMTCAAVTAHEILSREVGHLPEHQYFTEVFDAFDITATRRFVRDAEDTQNHQRRPPFCTLKDAILPAPLDGDEVEICDGHHYDSPTQFNVFAALMLQASRSPLWRRAWSPIGRRRSNGMVGDGAVVGGLCRVATSEMKLRNTELSPLPHRFAAAASGGDGGDRWRCADCVGDGMRENFGCLELRLRRLARCGSNQTTINMSGVPVPLDAPMNRFIALQGGERLAKSAELTASIVEHCPRWPFAAAA